jgi:hypothetical protein
MAVIGRIPNWDRFFDLSKPALKLTFFIQLLVLPAFYIIASSAIAGRSELLKMEAIPVNIPAIAIIGLVYLLSFSAVAYILTMIFDRQDRLRAWVIIRHWCVFFLAWIAALGFGLFKAGIFPLPAAYGVLFAAYMGLLFIDIRIAQRVAGFDLGGATLAGCLISITGLSLLLTGVSYFV